MLSNKGQKNITRERRPEPKVTTLSAKTTILEHSRGFRRIPSDSADPAEMVAFTAARTPLPHAPEARMTVVKQTPSNNLLHKGCQVTAN